MPDPDAAWNRAPGRGESRWRRFSASLPMRTALIAVSTVWILGCVWSYQEQSAFAASKGFTFPHLLPLVIDGFAVSMAGVAWAASLDARPAIPARLATIVAVAASSASNGAWAYLRAHHDITTVILGVTVPIAANLAFEVLLAELRRQVQRRRGLPPPVAIPYPRLIRITLAPFNTFKTWRTLVLELTALEHTVASTAPHHHAEPGIPPAATAGAQVPIPPPPAMAAAEPEPAQLSAPRTPELATAPPHAVEVRHDRDEQPDEAGPAPDEDTWQDEHGDEQRPERRSVDARVLRLARYLRDAQDADEVTGEMVGGLLGIEVAPRTGRRLLGQARELVQRETEAGDQRILELTAPGSR